MESGTETIKRDGVSTFGTVELFGSANSNLGFQLDTELFDLAVAHKPGTLPPDVAAFAGKTPGVPVLLRTIANKKLNRKDLEELTRYVDEKFGATCDGISKNPRTFWGETRWACGTRVNSA